MSVEERKFVRVVRASDTNDHHASQVGPREYLVFPFPIFNAPHQMSLCCCIDIGDSYTHIYGPQQVVVFSATSVALFSVRRQEVIGYGEAEARQRFIEYVERKDSNGFKETFITFVLQHH